MIYKNDLPKFNNSTESFNYMYELAREKKYKLPYMSQHYFRSGKYLIDGKIEEVLLSTWHFKTRDIDNKRITVGIMEFPKSYAMNITQHGIGLIGKTIWYEQLQHIPTWNEIEKLVRVDFK